MLAVELMSYRMSRLYGMDIYSDGGKYLGRVHDLIIDLEKGEIMRITLEPLQSVTREDAKRILREKSILYKNVKSVEDVIMVSGGTNAGRMPDEEEPAPAGASGPSFFGRG
jgi:sporulation protein YlmC with PRC-barrel domain